MKDKQIRVDLDFEKELREMKLNRIKSGVDKQMRSDRRLTKAIRRHRLFPKIKNDIIVSPLKDDKRGGMFDLITWLVVGFLVVLIFAVFIYASGLLTNSLLSTTQSESAPFNARVKRESSPVEAILAKGLRGSPGLVDTMNSTVSIPSLLKA